MTNKKAVNWIINLIADIGKIQHQDLWHYEQVLSEIREMLEAEPERPTGRWIDAILPNDNGGLPIQVCDQCNTFFPLAYTGGGHRFCPNCGAKMEV